MSGKKYAVKEGRNPGIYDNWSDAKEQTDGYSANEHKSFRNEQSAERFMQEGYTKPGYCPPNPHGNSGWARGKPDYREQGPSK